MKSLQRDAAGRIQHAFEDHDPPQDNKHPVVRYAKASEPLQRHIILNDKAVNGVLHLGHDDKFQIISLPLVTSDFENGTASLHGLLGTSASQNVPVKLGGECLSDVIALAESEPSVSPTMQPIEADDDISLEVPDNFKIIKLPLLIPLVGNHGIKCGHLDNKSVLQSITEHHPFMTTWLSGIQTFTSEDENTQVKHNRLTKDHPNLNESGSFKLPLTTELDAYDDPNPPMHGTTKHLEEIINKNNKEFYEKNPELLPQEMSINSANDVQPLLTMDDPVESSTSATMQKVQLPAISRNFKLFYGILDKDNKTIQAPELNPALSQLFTNGNTSTKFTSQVRKAIETYEETWSNSDNYLRKETDLPYLSHLIIMMLMTVNWKTDALDENFEFADKELSVLMLLPPPYAGKNQEYLKTLRSGLNIRLDEIVEQSSKFCERKSTKGFIGGRQWEINDNVSLLANLCCLSNFLMDSTTKQDVPLCALITKDLADLLSSKAMKKWHHKHKNIAPWIPHSINSLFHNAYAQFGRLAGDYSKQLDLLNGQMPSYDIYNNIYNDYLAAKGIIMAGIQQSSISSFVTPPGSWEYFAKEAPTAINDKPEGKKNKERDDSNQDSKRRDTKRPRFDSGWLVYKGEGLPKLPTLTGGRLCKDFVTVGRFCNRRDCNYGGHISYETLNNKDKDIMDEWIRNSRTISYKQG